MLRVPSLCSMPSPPPNHFNTNSNASSKFRPTASAKKSDAGQEPSPRALRISRALAAKSAIAVFALGFLDAGYSGDWSRIGVVSKETEEALKVAAFLVVPLSFLIAYSISDEEKRTDSTKNRDIN